MGERTAEKFDDEALRYDRIRPGPPEALIRAMIARGGLQPGARVLEVGCGSGQATAELAPRRLRIHAIDIGARLLELARQRLAPWPEVSFGHCAFEDFGSADGFDAIVSVQAFHWIGPAGLAKAAELLTPDGRLLLAWHLCASRETDFYQASRPIYARYQGETSGPAAENAPAQFARALAASPDFELLSEDVFPWSLGYTRGRYLELLQTFSDVLAMPESARRPFLAEIGALVDAHGGIIERNYRSRLLTARVIKK